MQGSGADTYESPYPAYMKSKLARSREILRTEGPRALWFKFLGEIVYRRLDVIERRVDPAAGSPGPGAGLAISLLQPGEIDEFLAFRSFVDRATVRKRLGRGQVCLLVRADGRIVHNVWAATGRVTIDYLDCDIQVADDTLYVFEAYTAPDFRGRSISSIRSRALERYCGAHGFTRLLAVVWPENPPVYRSFAKAGYVVSGRTGYLGFGRFKRHFCRYPGDDPPFRLLGRSGTDRFGTNGRYWDAVASQPEGRLHYLDPFLAQLKRREYLRLVRAWTRPRPGGRLLKTDAFEEAMGADSFLPGLLRQPVQITAIDVSPEIVHRATRKHAHESLHFLAADVRSLPFRDGVFAAVVSPSTLDHFPDAADLGVSLGELLRVIEPGGCLVITLDNRQNVFDPLLRLVHRLGLVPYFMGRSYTVAELSEALQHAGFEVAETTAILHNPRLMAVGAMRMARWLGWRWLIRRLQRVLLAARRLEHSRFCYHTGSFVAALAVRPAPAAPQESRDHAVEKIPGVSHR